MLIIKILWGSAIAALVIYLLIIAGAALEERRRTLLHMLGQGRIYRAFRRLVMWRWIDQNLEKACGFKCWPRTRYAIIGLLLAFMLGATCLTFSTTSFMPASAIIAMVVGFVLVLFLCVDSLYYYFDLFHSSPKEVLPLARSIDPLISKAIGDAEELVKGLESKTLKEESGTLKAEIESQAREITADFVTRPPYPRITALLFRRAILNFVLTICCFAIVSLALVHTDKYFDCKATTYLHDCTVISSPWRAVLHALYYHSVVFQSLGDGLHAPQTTMAQAIATVETFIAFFYFVLILGGIYNTATIVRDNLSPDIFKKSLAAYLTALCAQKLTVSKEDLEEFK